MSCETVAKRMGRNPFINTNQSHRPLDRLVDNTGINMVPPGHAA